MSSLPSNCECTEKKKVIDLDKKGTAWLEECTLCNKLWYCDQEGREQV